MRHIKGLHLQDFFFFSVKKVPSAEIKFEPRKCQPFHNNSEEKKRYFITFLY